MYRPRPTNYRKQCNSTLIDALSGVRGRGDTFLISIVINLFFYFKSVYGIPIILIVCFFFKSRNRVYLLRTSVDEDVFNNKKKNMFYNKTYASTENYCLLFTEKPF